MELSERCCPQTLKCFLSGADVRPSGNTLLSPFIRTEASGLNLSSHGPEDKFAKNTAGDRYLVGTLQKVSLSLI